MGLNWNLSAVKDYKSVCYEVFTGSAEEMERRVNQVHFMSPSWQYTDDSKSAVTRIHPTTFVLIFSTLSVGLGQISEANVEEFHRRLSAWEEKHGALRIGVKPDGERVSVPYTLDEVRKHIGLTTNVASIPKRSFNAKMRRAK